MYSIKKKESEKNFSENVAILDEFIMISIFERHVRTTPDVTAVVTEDGQRFSYQQIDALVCDLAQSIAKVLYSIFQQFEIGTGENDTPLVSILMSRNVGAIIAMLATLKAGGGNYFEKTNHSYYYFLLLFLFR